MHLNLKPEVIFFDEELRPRVGEFSRVRADDSVTRTPFVTASCTQAPEMFDPETPYSRQADVYSYGMSSM
jgi:serine/threonine protein kinase